MERKVANPIKQMRQALGWSQTKCAKLAGMHQSTWARCENHPNFLSLRERSKIRISDALGTNVVGMIIEWQIIMGENDER